MRPATRSNGTRSQPCAHTIRLTETWNDRLHDAARAAGKNIQNFCFDAIAEAILKAEEQEEKRRAIKRARKAAYEADGDRDEAPAVGFGIRNALGLARRRRFEEDETPQAPQIVVNANAPASTEPNVEHFARYVANGAKWNRDARKKEALKVLHASTADIEERHQLTKALDDRIMALTGEPQDLMERVKRNLFGSG